LTNLFKNIIEQIKVDKLISEVYNSAIEFIKSFKGKEETSKKHLTKGAWVWYWNAKERRLISN